MAKLIDKYNRTINYLRISVTDRCNMRCVYCMPKDGIFHKSPNEILSFEDIFKIAKLTARLGIEKIRITGGEPLVRKDIHLLIKSLKTIKGIKEIALTTNGAYLSEYARLLKESGLDRINVSLDSLVGEKFCKITRGGNIKKVLEGVESALSIGFSSIKINTVLLKGFNDDEIINFALLAKERPLNIRFIEYMPTGLNWALGDERGIFFEGNPFLSAASAKEICEGLGKLTAVKAKKASTAKVFKIKGFKGTVGFISPITMPFCKSCNKLRLTSGGILRSCLHSGNGVDLKKALQNGAPEELFFGLIREAVGLKPESHRLSDLGLKTPDEDIFSMCQIGG